MDSETNKLLAGLVTTTSGRMLVSPRASSPDIESSPGRSFVQSPALLRSLGKTRAWLLTLAILSIAAYGLFFLGMLYFALSGGGAGAVEVVVALVFTLVSLFPTFFMTNYARQIQAFLVRRQPEQFLQVLAAQRSLWMVLGVYALLFFLLGIVMLVMLFLAVSIHMAP